MTAARSEAPRPSTPGPRGEVKVVGTTADLTFRRSLRHPPQRVWAAITEPEQMREWFLTNARVDPRVGGALDFEVGKDRIHSTGRVRTWDPPRVFEYDWRLDATEREPDGDSATVRWELTPTPEGTDLLLTIRGLRKGTAQVFAGGLRKFLDRLGAQLDRAPMPAWAAGWAESAPDER